MKNKFSFTISLLLLCALALACNFKLGDAGGETNGEVVQKTDSKEKPEKKKDEKNEEKTPDSAEAKKIGGYTYQRFDYTVYKIPKNLSEGELKEIAQNLHEREPRNFLVLVDDDSKAGQYITFHEQAEKGTQETEFPLEWANEHIVASVVMFLEGEKKWYLTKGYGYEKIAGLE